MRLVPLTVPVCLVVWFSQASLSDKGGHYGIIQRWGFPLWLQWKNTATKELKVVEEGQFRRSTMGSKHGKGRGWNGGGNLGGNRGDKEL